MNQHGKNKLKMYKTVAAICTANAGDWNGLPAFTNAFAQFAAKLDALEQAAYKQGFATAGVTAAKQQVLEQTIAKAETVANALRAFAAAKDDALLAGQLKFSKSEFKRGGNQLLLQLTDRILGKAGEHVTDLTDYGVSQTDIDDLAALRTELGQTIESPRSAIVERRQETLQIAELTEELDDLLRNHLDRLVQVLHNTHQAFYKRYTAARVIVDYKGKTNDHGEPEGPNDPGGMLPKD